MTEQSKEFLKAAQAGDVSRLQQFYDTASQLLHDARSTSKGYCALHFASMAGSLEAINWLVAHGLTPDDVATVNSATPLDVALEYRRSDATARLRVLQGSPALSMEQRLQQLPESERRAAVGLALTRLREWRAAASQQQDEPLDAIKARLRNDSRVWQIDNVFDAAECAVILRAVREAAERRGWDKLRHGKHPTTDLPLGAVPKFEAMVRARLFRHVLRRLAPIYMHAHYLPEHLELRDAFFVKYSAAPGQQRSLETHTDGSIFSVNVLLSDPDCDFDGGGTWFEAWDTTVTPPRGSAIGHSGQARHSGIEITRGERFVLVAFIGSVASPYSLQQPEWAVHDAFLKFGSAAWAREDADLASPANEPPMLVLGSDESCEQAEVGP